MYDYFGHGFHTLSVVKYLKAKVLSEGEPWDKILLNEGPWSNLGSLGITDVKKFESHCSI